MKGLVVALQFMTRLPTPRLNVSSDEFAASMRWFPAVGLIIGCLIAAGAWAGAQISPWLGALAATVIWAAVTGGLHLDGLGDIADASGAAHKQRDKMISVMADPHVGSFAVITIVLQLIAKLVLLHLLISSGNYLALAFAPFAARIGPLLWSTTLPDLHQGLGSRFRGVIRPLHLAVWTVVLAVACRWEASLVVTPLLLLVWQQWIKRRIGGISGDGHGAGIEITETLLLLAATIAGHLL